ncbi:MAG TPA: 16S rRNA (adenine(1518)-N(6)/adenine(1519)-N(6))-dimethyltransferase RsmA, partial [Actinomycetes bacterium]|nr:16S rRNA (adenine(1518)-N(6)/adenine(1519)-N(6))-dimethyltransferase RsmA [Actinomycetes bacterium]
QNYLVDPNTARKIVRLAEVEPGETVLEIGPGLGSLTLALRQAGARVVAVEADDRLLPALAEAIGDDPGVRVVAGDALRLELTRLAPDAHKLVANLPYNLAATLVLEVLTAHPTYQRLTVMVQREVGERLAASPGSGAYGATSVKVAALAEARLLAPVGRKVFLPEPHVDSVLVALRRRPHPATEGLPWPVLDRVIEAAFSQRRKTLRNSLRTLGLDQHEVEALGRAARLDLGLRAERLDVAAFAALAAALQGMPGPLERRG